ncbi:MAG: discoidin domain-containing protein [Actinomycetota bacterium]
MTARQTSTTIVVADGKPSQPSWSHTPMRFHLLSITAAVRAICAAVIVLPVAMAAPLTKPGDTEKLPPPSLPAAAQATPAAAPSKPNLAGQATVSASSTQPGNSPDRAVDDATDTRWCASSGDAPQWWQAEFDTPQPLVGIDLDWEFPGKTYRYRVETSPDGKTWAVVVDAANGVKSPATHAFTGPQAVGVKGVRVHFLGADGGWGSLREVGLTPPPGTVVPQRKARPAAGSADGLLGDVKAPEGFTTTIFATPGQANYPVFVAATHDGTVFVSSDGNGSLGRDPDRGRIIRLRDTDGDGRADDVKTFVSDLDSPRGLVWVDDRLVVLHPPHISSFRDSDGDGHADERTLLVRGIAFDYSQRPADHTSNGLALGIDGWIYAAIGDFGFMDAEGTDGRHLQLRGGGLVRFRPDGSGLDLFARGTRNNLEAAVGPLLDMIARDNTTDGGGWNVRLHAFTGLEDHGYPRRYMHFADEIVPPLADYGGGSGTGACWIDEPWMPERWNNAAFTCDWGRGEVFRHAVRRSGAGTEADQEPFLKITRSTDLDVDALGHIYAASWRGGGFSWGGPEIGFVARVTPTGRHDTAKLPDLDRATVPDLIGLLRGPSHRLRLEAQRVILRRGLAEQATGDLQALASDASARLASRVAAVFTLAVGRSAAAVPALVRLATDPVVAPWALRAIGDLAASGSPVPHGALVTALAASDPRVRGEAVVALVRTASDAAAPPVLAATADVDRLVAHTAVEGLVRLARSSASAVLAACAAAVDSAATPPAVHRSAARVLGELHEAAAVDLVIARLAAESEPTRRANLIWAAARLFRRESAWKGDGWGTRPDTRGPYYAAEDWETSPRILAATLAGLARSSDAERPALGRALGLHRLPAPAVIDARLAGPGGGSAIVAFLDAAGGPPPEKAVPASAAAATAAATPLPDRLAAIRVLATVTSPAAAAALVDASAALPKDGAGGQESAATRLTVGVSPAALQHLDTVLSAATKSPAHAAVVDEILLGVAGCAGAKSSVRGAASTRLEADWARDPARRLALVAASVRAGSRVLATRLVDAAEQDGDQPLRTAARAALTALGIDARKIREIAADTGPKVAARKPDDVLTLVDGQRGDRAVGAELFVAKKCNACHAAGVDSAGLGPSLANAAGIYNRKQLAESVLLPNKTIAQGFATTVLTLDDGRQLTGFVTSEAADLVRLRDAQGAEHMIAKPTIEARTKLPTSVMPEGLVADLTIAQFASLLDYIEAIGK